MHQAHMALGTVGKGSPLSNDLYFLGPKAVLHMAVLLR